jgi:hypothetical protein
LVTGWRFATDTCCIHLHFQSADFLTTKNPQIGNANGDNMYLLKNSILSHDSPVNYPGRTHSGIVKESIQSRWLTSVLLRFSEYSIVCFTWLVQTSMILQYNHVSHCIVFISFLRNDYQFSNQGTSQANNIFVSQKHFGKSTLIIG